MRLPIVQLSDCQTHHQQSQNFLSININGKRLQNISVQFNKNWIAILKLITYHEEKGRNERSLKRRKVVHHRTITYQVRNFHVGKQQPVYVSVCNHHHCNYSNKPFHSVKYFYDNKYWYPKKLKYSES